MVFNLILSIIFAILGTFGYFKYIKNSKLFFFIIYLISSIAFSITMYLVLIANFNLKIASGFVFFLPIILTIRMIEINKKNKMVQKIRNM